MGSERGQSTDEGLDLGEVMREAQSWKTDIMDNHSGGSPACDIPMMVLINKKKASEAAAAPAVHVGGSGMPPQDHGELEHHQGGINHEQLVDLATNSGFSSWFVLNNNNSCSEPL